MSNDNKKPIDDALSQLKLLDPERYTACLYLPEEIRSAATTLYLFDAEIARIPDLISEPMPGEIRIQFWKDILTKGDSKEGGPLAQDLLDVIDAHKLPKEILHNYLNARIFDLYHDPMPDMGSFEGYLGETHSAIIQLIALMAGAERSTQLANACGHAGMAFGITRLLAGISHHHHNRHIYVPVSLLSEHGLSTMGWLNEQPSNSHQLIISEMVVLARKHYAEAMQDMGTLNASTKPVFLPLAFVEPTLKQIEKAKLNLFEYPIKLSSLKRQWTALRWAMKD